MKRPYRKRGITYFTPPPIVPIPIRADLTVYIQGMPIDMTYDEAAKVSRVVMALAFALPSAGTDTLTQAGREKLE